MDCIFSRQEAVLPLPAERDGAVWRFAHPTLPLAFHRHCELEMNLVTQGEAVYLLDDRRYALRPGAMAWLFPAQNHILLDRSPDFAMWILVMRPVSVTRWCGEATSKILRESNPPGSYCRNLDRANFLRLCGLFAEIAAVDAPAHFNAGLGYALLSAWAAYEAVGAAGGKESACRVHPAIETTARRLREETEATSLKQLAAQHGLSVSRLSTLFKEQTGVPLARYRNQQRLERFLRLRADDSSNSRTLLEMALEAGFGSYAQFYRVFRERMACPPATYPAQIGPPANAPSLPEETA